LTPSPSQGEGWGEGPASVVRQALLLIPALSPQGTRARHGWLVHPCRCSPNHWRASRQCHLPSARADSIIFIAPLAPCYRLSVPRGKRCHPSCREPASAVQGYAAAKFSCAPFDRAQRTWYIDCGYFVPVGLSRPVRRGIGGMQQQEVIRCVHCRSGCWPCCWSRGSWRRRRPRFTPRGACRN